MKTAIYCTFNERASYKFEDFVEYYDREGHLEDCEPLGKRQRCQLEDRLRRGTRSNNVCGTNTNVCGKRISACTRELRSECGGSVRVRSVAYCEELAVEQEEVEAEREHDRAQQPPVRPGWHAQQRLVLTKAKCTSSQHLQVLSTLVICGTPAHCTSLLHNIKIKYTNIAQLNKHLRYITCTVQRILVISIQLKYIQ